MSYRGGTTRGVILSLGLLVFTAGCQTTATQTGKPDGQNIQAEQLYRVANTTRAGGDLAAALVLYQRANAAKPNWPAPVLAIGETASTLGAHEDARNAYTEAAKLEPDSLDAQLGIGKASLSLNDPKKAIAAYTKATALAEDKDHRPFNGLGVAQDLLGDHAAAQKSYRKGLDRASDNITLLNNLGLSLALQGDFATAIQVLGELAADPASTARSRQNLALIYGLSGDDARAAKIARLDLTEEQVNNNLARYKELRALPSNDRVRKILVPTSP